MCVSGKEGPLGRVGFLEMAPAKVSVLGRSIPDHPEQVRPSPVSLCPRCCQPCHAGPQVGFNPIFKSKGISCTLRVMQQFGPVTQFVSSFLVDCGSLQGRVWADVTKASRRPAHSGPEGLSVGSPEQPMSLMAPPTLCLRVCIS